MQSIKMILKCVWWHCFFCRPIRFLNISQVVCTIHEIFGITFDQDQRIFDTHEDAPEREFKSRLIMIISIVFSVCFTGNNNDFCLQLYFQLFIAEHSGLLPKCLAFPASWTI